MATVDGKVVAADKYGIIQGDGGDVDKMSGGSGNDKLQGHAEFNQYFGGAGNDTFILSSKYGKHIDTTSKDKADLAAYIVDFQNANGDSSSAANAPGDHDFISFSGFGAGSTLTEVGVGISGTTNAKLYYYAIFDTATNDYYNFQVNSINGKGLGLGDYAFYGSVPSIAS